MQFELGQKIIDLFKKKDISNKDCKTQDIIKDGPVRAYVILDLIKKNKINPKEIAEIGVWRGHTSIVLLRNLPSLEVFHAIDSWINYEDYQGDNKNNETIIFDKLIFEDRTHWLKDKLKIHHGFSKDTCDQIRDNSLDLIFIDANHSYEYLLEDIKIWTPKVKKDGLIIGHDYNPKTFPGVVKAVHEVFKDNFTTELDDIWWCTKK